MKLIVELEIDKNDKEYGSFKTITDREQMRIRLTKLEVERFQVECAMVAAVKALIEDYKPPFSKTWIMRLETSYHPNPNPYSTEGGETQYEVRITSARLVRKD